MASHAPATHNEALAQIYARYDQAISSGDFLPFVYPWGSFGALACFLYLLIPHFNSPVLKGLRFPVWAFNAYCSIYAILYCRARNMAPAFGVGLISSWSLLWTFTLLVVHDAQTDFARIERTEGACARLRNTGSATANGAALKDKPHDDSLTVSTIKDADLAAEQKKLGTTAGPAQRTGIFAWQHFPLSPFIERLDWVADVFCNFRGMGWNWRIPGLAPPPRWVQQQLHANSGTPAPDDTTTSDETHIGLDGTHQPQTRREALFASLRTLVTGYLILDFLKVIVLHDPYFWGVIDAPPPTFLPVLIRTSPTLTRIYRLLITLNAIKWALTSIFALAPLFFLGILGPRAIGARASPWMYPSTFGSYTTVLDKGLGGWWGSWWHQTFRFAFSSPSQKLAGRLGLPRRHPLTKLLHLSTAFLLSGLLHAAGSTTQSGATHPLSGPLLFFASQPLGIALQLLLASLLRRAGVVTPRTPRALRQLGNFLYVHAWFFATAPLLADDFARGGIWLFEPVPLSPLRALGLGDADSGWNCWKGKAGADWVRWHQGKRWWESGIAF
ncbi:hypothetical protein MPH_06888 [Macrophomina phaseolina MS6]|uniref:Wax synthase domain-containing protein n=1 Tax=Macrophomina phaseolina (strain MS6) TaxID=1126212 RepID=K2RT80_MACPH|nr:hypothetical protein MPH_06888 [Macrophomina phaseolina MS6]